MTARLVTVVLGAYLLAGIPVGTVALVGGVPRTQLLRWWSWGALAVVAVAFLQDLAVRL